jgi:hypothetical protein
MYFPHGEAWYHGQVWANVFVLAPLSILGAIGFLWHHSVVKELHRKVNREAAAREAAHTELMAAHAEHAQHLKKLMDALDPETDGGISEVVDRLEPGTPSGIGVLNGKLDRLGKSLALEPVKPDTTLHLDHPEDAK